MRTSKKYAPIIERIFFAGYKEGAREVPFKREDIVYFARELGIELPKNLGDVPYSFRFRKALPDSACHYPNLFTYGNSRRI